MQSNKFYISRVYFGKIWHIGKCYHGFIFKNYIDNAWFEIKSIQLMNHPTFIINEWYIIENYVHKDNTLPSYQESFSLQQFIKDARAGMPTIHPDLVNIIIEYMFDLYDVPKTVLNPR